MLSMSIANGYSELTSGKVSLLRVVTILLLGLKKTEKKVSNEKNSSNKIESKIK